MGNCLSIEVAELKLRSTGETQQELHVYDDYEKAVILREGIIPEEPHQLLMLVCRLNLQGVGDKLVTLLGFHLRENNVKGINIETDYIELDDDRISDIVKAYRENNREFFGLED